MVDTIFVLVTATCYPTRLAPAAEAFARTGDIAPIVKLLHEAQRRLRSIAPKENPFLIEGREFEQLQDHLNILEGREFYGPSTDHTPPHRGAKTSKADLKLYVESQVYETLFTGLCVAYRADVPANQVLTRGRPLPYLEEHLDTIDPAFTGLLKGKTLKWLPAIELMANEDMATLVKRLDLVPIPDDKDEQRKINAKLDELMNRTGVAVSSQFADVFGKPASVQLAELKKILRVALSTPGLAIVRQIE